MGDPSPGNTILGVETSCDETAIAVVERASVVRSSVVSSQVKQHAEFGGVVPEIAGRAHVRELVPVLAEALATAGIDNAIGPDGVDAVAATTGPGLVGSLLVGVSAAKALSLVWGVPFVSVNHLEAHLYASFLEEPDLELPLVVLLVSGGHTMLVLMEGHGRYRLLGSTLDDAAGEAYDKVARYLGLGYPGGPAIDALAVDGDPTAFDYPRALVQENPDTLPDDRRYAFSFSGLKTAVVNHVRNEPDAPTADVAASFQAAVVDALVTKARWAVEATGAVGACLGGGVAANSLLRDRFAGMCSEAGVRPFVPSRAMCTDNAAMVAAAGWWRLQSDGPSPLDVGADPNLALPLIN
ncbi:MAG: tRNA (adenosine(37)-N6)-threonylcarbamoyltransferase complex transferase subunit TsaD [Acidimicrobiales bacterium]|jgi:N6-L-threonylcarbamoyladenine synthase|nr:tRNA (adenosine(37)-N6)-threonylcarbamoyltransferase complex transferase subunit TsaD [Acidimicrobiales bacterium]